jgi:hypothetical protein
MAHRLAAPSIGQSTTPRREMNAYNPTGNVHVSGLDVKVSGMTNWFQDTTNA